MSWIDYTDWIPVYHDDADNPDSLFDRNYNGNELHTVSFYWNLIDKAIPYPFYLSSSDYFKEIIMRAVKKMHGYFTSLNKRAVQLEVMNLDSSHILYLQINRDGKYDFFICEKDASKPCKWKSGSKSKDSRSRRLKCWYLTAMNWKSVKGQASQIDEKFLEMTRSIQDFDKDDDSPF